jgi:hypothetical protein
MNKKNKKLLETLFLSLINMKNIVNKRNFCKYPPAIFSSPKKLEGLFNVMGKPITLTSK